MKIYAYDPKKDKTILTGDLLDGCFYKPVTSANFMRIVDGYGIQESAFQEVCERGCKKIAITQEATRAIWYSTPDDWIEHGKVADYGSGKQRFLSLKYMTKKLIS